MFVTDFITTATEPCLLLVWSSRSSMLHTFSLARVLTREWSMLMLKLCPTGYRRQCSRKCAASTVFQIPQKVTWKKHLVETPNWEFCSSELFRANKRFISDITGSQEIPAMFQFYLRTISMQSNLESPLRFIMFSSRFIMRISLHVPHILTPPKHTHSHEYGLTSLSLPFVTTFRMQLQKLLPKLQRSWLQLS